MRKQPNIENLRVGMIFKNFKQLVEYVGLDCNHGGRAYYLLKKKLARYVEWERQIDPITKRKKHSLIITKIY